LLDNKLVALSLAFTIYRSFGRPRKWREKLKKLVFGNNDLEEQLTTYLNPPPMSATSKRWKRREARWEKRDAANQKKKEEQLAEWKTHFRKNLDDLRDKNRKSPDKLTNEILYLFERCRSDDHTGGHWAEYNWKGLIDEYGEPVARFYRDSAVSMWRSHKPKIYSEGGTLNQTPYAVIVGLSGLEIEARETEGWPNGLSQEEVEHACRYASSELNGFPTWFPDFAQMYADQVGGFVLQEICFELSIEKSDTETHYLLSDISWSGQWIWDQIAPDIYDLLQKKEPRNLTNLDKILKIVQGSSFSDELVERLAAKKCQSRCNLEHKARWYAVWMGVAPENAIPALRVQISQIAHVKKRTEFSMKFVTHLLGGRRRSGIALSRDAFKTPEHLKSLYLLMHQYIRRKDDIDRAGKGVYSPELRDNAQDARDTLFEHLNGISGKEAFLALEEIGRAHPEISSRPWMLQLAKQKAERDGDIKPWSADQVHEFDQSYEQTPGNHRELAELVILRFCDLKDDLENGDSSIAGILKNVSLETDMRKYIGKELRDKSHNRYSIPQEEELADAKKPDFRFHGVGFDAPVPAELKLADNWTGNKLFERLENQLCGDYLRDNRSNRGVFVLVHRGKKKDNWDLPDSQGRVGFAQLVEALQAHWTSLSPSFAGVDDITVVGIDLTKRSGR